MKYFGNYIIIIIIIIKCDCISITYSNQLLHIKKAYIKNQMLAVNVTGNLVMPKNVCNQK